MKVAILAPIAWRTPPRKYGPWEQVASNLTEGLLGQGIEVTLFATADSLTKAQLHHSSPAGYAENSTLDPKVEECLHISQVMELAADFDIIHNHFDFLPLTYAKLINTPMVTTIHGFSSPKIIPVYKKYNKHCFYVAISNSDRCSELDYVATVYNGIDTSHLHFSATGRDYLLYFGRIHPEKGAHLAIRIAKLTGKQLILAGLIQDQHYFTEHVLPHIDEGQIQYLGNVGPAERNDLLGGASALLHLIEFDEPFGLSVAEAMLCGTPVIAMNRGAMPELIRHGTTGFLVNDVLEAVQAVGHIHDLARDECHQWAKSKFTKEKMTEDYITVYRHILGC
ncbi:glycosyltransferase family 4 protein [Olivibacter domesticus]|uniref:Glycosyltransferase involved in cell wall bisynthesis n=1 Tax=Olivibacter domesticus TaxID=407022 RepID=A0A1H7KRY6_OLID1|nr:glycosyltransferase family 4 protein [Olivibacter domesticus]SEK88697.1 Glycosyltransferase involved in cell wall bisynthesis [Olivibacter domesticus]